MDNKNMVEENTITLFADREMKGGPASFAFSSSVTGISDNGETCVIDTAESDSMAMFAQNYRYWNKETQFSSANNIDNAYFQGIIDMGVNAVPYIVKELDKGPSPLVYALDMIFPGVMKYEGFVSLKEACDKWLSILR